MKAGIRNLKNLTFMESTGIAQWEWAGTNGYQAPKLQIGKLGVKFLVLPKKIR